MTYRSAFRLLIAGASLLSLALTGCFDQSGPTAPKTLPSKPSMDGELDIEWSDGNEFMFDLAQADPSYPYSASYPSWNGEVELTQGAPLECPPIWAGITRFYHQGSGRWFIANPGFFRLMMPVFPGTRFPNLPHAS